MADLPDTDFTQCDSCEKKVRWQETRHWHKFFDRCYCPECFHVKPRVITPTARKLFKSDLVYQGDPYHD